MASDTSKLTYNLVYCTKSVYAKAVKEATFELIVAPCTQEGQEVLSVKISTEPNCGYAVLKNRFGFDSICVNIGTPFSEFSCSVISRVIKSVANPFDFLFLEPSVEKQIMNSLEFKIDNYQFLNSGHYVNINYSELEGFAPLKDEEQLFEYLQRLNGFVYNNFTFCDKSSHVHTTAQETLISKRGVCQDFAHLFIGICQAEGVAVRYVSGYLHQGIGHKGDSFLHAWVEVLIPGAGWIGLDPTNNLLVDEHYIKIAHGADYSDCAPIKGALKYDGEMDTQYLVKVKLDNQ